MITTSRLQVTGVTGGPLRITGASLVNGAYDLATAGGADYELLTERQTTMDNILFIPGIANPVAEIRQLLFGAGQPGGSWIPSLSAAMIAANSFGSGVTDILDLSGNNNPFSQATSGSRGAWFREPKRGRVNLLLRTEQLTTAPWDASAGGNAFQGTGVAPVITPNFGLAPNGTLTATRLQLNCGAGTTADDRSGFAQTFSGLSLSPYTSSFYVKPLDGTTAGQLESSFHFGSLLGGGTVTNNVATAVGDGWFFLTRRTTPTVTTGSWRFQLRGDLGLQTLDCLVWRPQMELGSTATAYQRVTTAFDVTEQGQRDCYGVLADGIDDFYTTASIDFTGTNKVTVFAAMRKVSDAAIGVVTELTTNTNSENGSFFLAAPSSLAIDSARNVGFNARGTATGTAAVATGLASPVTFITTGQADIAAPSVSIRSNGVLIQTTTATLGSGSFANDILYLFRRGGATFPFNGRLYALIVAGGSYPLSTIQRVERLLSRITPTVNL